jgi:hypothetical protein
MSALTKLNIDQTGVPTFERMCNVDRLDRLVQQSTRDQTDTTREKDGVDGIYTRTAVAGGPTGPSSKSCGLQ